VGYFSAVARLQRWRFSKGFKAPKLSSQGNHNQETKLPKLKKDAKAPLGGFGGKKGTGRKTFFLISLN
jgi:hypothetical protein